MSTGAHPFRAASPAVARVGMPAPQSEAASTDVVLEVGRLLLVRPLLLWVGLGALRRLAPPGWWRRFPYLPFPDRRLWTFRMETAYGDPQCTPSAADVVSYLEWCRATAGRPPSGTGFDPRALIGAGADHERRPG